MSGKVTHNVVRWMSVIFVVLSTSPTFAQLESFTLFDDPRPLREADTSSPRDTLRSFIRGMNSAFNEWHRGENPASYEPDFLRAAGTLDFSDLPPYRQRAAKIVKIALLKEILDRIQLPPFSEIPGRQEVQNANITRWKIPSTSIEIVKIESGVYAGQFLFSRETVRNLKEKYALIRGLPYKKGATVDLYDEIRYRPGVWLPLSLTDILPGWSTSLFLGQGIWQWIILAITLLLAFLLIRTVYRIGQAWDELYLPRNAWLRVGTPLAILVAIAVAEIVYRFALHGIGLYELPLDVVSYTVLVTQVGGFAWFALVIAGRLADAFAQDEEKSTGKQRADAALLRILFRLLSLFILVYLGIFAAEALGIPIAPLIAGLGVGGLAIALAVRPTLENVIGGLTLFADRPVRVGDFCRYGANIGTVEQIGLRSTRIRSLERTLVTIPNATFAQMELDNFAARDIRLLKTILQLRYETTPDQLRYVLAELRSMLLGHPKVTEAPARVRFVDYGAYSLDLEIFAYLHCQDQDTFLAIKEDILLRIGDIIAKAGTGFAYPSQTMYYTRDSGLDVERGKDAETQVEILRTRNKLPFPEFDEEEREELEDVLDYPQRGSPDYQPRFGAQGAAQAASAQPIQAPAKLTWRTLLRRKK